MDNHEFIEERMKALVLGIHSGNVNIRQWLVDTLNRHAEIVREHETKMEILGTFIANDQVNKLLKDI